MKKNFNLIIIILFGMGIFLLIVNIYGIFIPFKNALIYKEKHVLFKNDIHQSSEYQINNILNSEISNRKLYFKKLVNTVNANIAHYWEDKGRIKYNLTIPIYKNYILFMASYFLPRYFKKYEFCDFRRALQRGVGLCSQHAITICGILEEKGVPCKIVGLSGHVIAMAEVENNKWWILDGDYGVIIPYDIKQVEKNPSIIKPYYEDKLNYSDHAIKTGKFKSLQSLIELYGKEGNRVVEGVRGYCGIKKMIICKGSFYAIWIIPFIFILPFVVKYIGIA